MSTKVTKLPVDQKVLLTRAEAMALTERNSDSLFDKEILPYVRRQRSGNKWLFPKARVLAVANSSMYAEEGREILTIPEDKKK